MTPTILTCAAVKLPPRCLMALMRLPAHVQQVDMESNGKRVALDGTPLPFAAGEVNFGEPGAYGKTVHLCSALR